MDGEVETVAVAGDVMGEEIKGGKDNVNWSADREGEIVDCEVGGGKERGWMIGGRFGDFKC